MNTQFYLQSNHYVPDRMLKNIDKTTSLMMESGLHQLYTSMTDFKQKLVDRVYAIVESEDFRALTMEQLKRPLILLFCLWGVALIVFIAETIASKWELGNRKPIRTRPDRHLHISHTA